MRDVYGFGLVPERLLVFVFSGKYKIKGQGRVVFLHDMHFVCSHPAMGAAQAEKAEYMFAFLQVNRRYRICTLRVIYG